MPDLIQSISSERARLPRNPLIGLSAIQEAALEFATTSKISSSLYCEPDDSICKATLGALVKSGYLQKPKGYRYWLSAKGERAHRILTRTRLHKDALKTLCTFLKDALEWFENEHGTDADITANDFSVPDWVLEARIALDENQHLTQQH